MSCDIRWDSFANDSFKSWTKELLYDSLNSGKRPNILSSEINIKDLNFGAKPPIFEILEIGDLANDKFRGIFKLKYDGDAHITLSTSIQANLLNIYSQSNMEDGGGFALPNFKLSSQPFSIPLFVNLSNIILSGIIIVVFSKSKGLTLVFKNDPLENIKVSSSFDNVQIIEKFLQKKIENQIRDLFRDVLPSVLHKLSQKYTTGNTINQLVKLNKASKGERISLFEINPLEPEISPINLLKISTLTASRLSFKLSIDPFIDVIERPNLCKYDSDHNNEDSILTGSKKIPVELICNTKSYELDQTLVQICKKQSKLYQLEKNNYKLKKRKIQLGKKREVNDINNDRSNDEMNNDNELNKDIHDDTNESINQTRSTSMNTLVDEDITHHEIQLPRPSLNSIFLSKISNHSNELIPTFISRSSSPIKSSKNVLNVGLGVGYGPLWASDAPPPYHQV